MYNREYQYQQRRRFDSQPAVGGRRVEAAQAELGGEEAGQYARNKRPKRVRLAGKHWFGQDNSIIAFRQGGRGH